MILDTNAVSSLADEDTALIRVLGSPRQHHLPVVVIGEYAFGIAASRPEQELRSWLTDLISESIVLPMELETARYYARVRNELKRAGKPIPVNDLWIAALARQHALPIISRDAHFDSVSGVQRVSW
jgi:predicted nucleic acid-binding protein